MNWKNLHEAEVGDYVEISPPYSRQLHSIEKVVKITSRTIETSNGRKFNIRNGNAWGSGDRWRFSSIHKLLNTEELKKEAKQKIQKQREENELKKLACQILDHTSERDLMKLGKERLEKILADCKAK